MTRPRLIATTLTLGLAAVLTLTAGIAPAAAEEETRTLALSPANAVVESGVPVTFEVTVLDQEGGVPLDPQPELDFVFGTDAQGDVVDGNTITAYSAGPRAVFVRSGLRYGVTELIVTGDPVDLAISPSATSVDKGGSLTFEVTGVDDWGNPVDASDALLTSSVATDVVSGHKVTFPTASPHTITATLGELTASVTVQVLASAAPAGPADTTTDDTATASKTELAATGSDLFLPGVLGVLFVLGGAMTLLVARRRHGARARATLN
ncbi:hypothetical protein [Agromyces bauzanensis]